MRRFISALCSAALLGALFVVPGAAPAQAGSFDDVNVTYHNGPLLQNVEVSLLFWGSYWRDNPPDYFQSFYQDLFADGSYMRNLHQYSTDSYDIENGQLVATALDLSEPPGQVTEAQVQDEIRKWVDRGWLPPRDENSLYVVVTSPDVVAVLSDGSQSGRDWGGYHNFASRGGFAYAEIAANGYNGDLTPMTWTMSHELAEAVTDPVLWQGWYDDSLAKNGRLEIADVVEALYNAKRIGFDDWADYLQGASGNRYEVAKVWSKEDGKPVAFAMGDSGPGSLQ